MTAPQIADLSIVAKTAGAHVQHTYTKDRPDDVGRGASALFTLQHGLLPPAAASPFPLSDFGLVMMSW